MNTLGVVQIGEDRRPAAEPVTNGQSSVKSLEANSTGRVNAKIPAQPGTQPPFHLLGIPAHDVTTSPSPPPPPGSDEALDLGCTCPRMDNAYGRGYMGMSGKPRRTDQPVSVKHKWVRRFPRNAPVSFSSRSV